MYIVTMINILVGIDKKVSKPMYTYIHSSIVFYHLRNMKLVLDRCYQHREVSLRYAWI